jgi:hypothetical protein
MFIFFKMTVTDIGNKVFVFYNVLVRSRFHEEFFWIFTFFFKAGACGSRVFPFADLSPDCSSVVAIPIYGPESFSQLMGVSSDLSEDNISF